MSVVNSVVPNRERVVVSRLRRVGSGGMLRVAVDVNVVVDVVSTVDKLVSVVKADTGIVVEVVISEVIFASSKVNVVLVVDTVEVGIGLDVVTVLVAVSIGMRRHEQTYHPTESPSEKSIGGITHSARRSRKLGRLHSLFLLKTASRRAAGVSFRW